MIGLGYDQGNAIIDDVSTESDNARLARIDDRIERVTSDLRRYLGEEYKRLLSLLDAGNFAEARASLARTNTLRDELNQRIEGIRTDMLTQVRSDAVMTMRDQKTAIVISVVLTLLAGILGLMFSLFISEMARLDGVPPNRSVRMITPDPSSTRARLTTTW